MIAVVVPKCSAIFGRLGKKLFIASIEMLASSTKVNMLGWVLRSKNATEKVPPLKRTKLLIKLCPYNARNHVQFPYIKFLFDMLHGPSALQ